MQVEYAYRSICKSRFLVVRRRKGYATAISLAIVYIIDAPLLLFCVFWIIPSHLSIEQK